MANQYGDKVISAVSITTSNTKTQEYSALFIGVGGDVSLVLKHQLTTTALFKNVGSGEFLPVATYRIRATGTAATNILGCKVGI